MKAEMKDILASSCSAIHLCLDVWTSSNKFSFLAVTVHYVDSDWTLVEKLLQFQETTDHSGSGMAEIVNSTLNEFGLTARLGCITMDNATNNDSLVTTLAETYDQDHNKQWCPDESRIRCLPHVINLAVQAFLKSIGYDEEGASQADDDDVFSISSDTLIKRLRFIGKKLSKQP